MVATCILLTASNVEEGYAHHVSRFVFDYVSRIPSPTDAPTLMPTSTPSSGPTAVRSSASKGQAKMFVHIPKTGGSTIQASMQGIYRQLFNDSRPYRRNATRCPSTTSKWHLTPAEMSSCRFKVPEGPTLCVVRHPLDRFLSEVSYRALAKKNDPEVIFYEVETNDRLSPEQIFSMQVSYMIELCMNATPMMPFDVFSHCQPQTNYLYYHNGSSTCDYLLANITRHKSLLRALLNSTSEQLPHLNISPEIPKKWALHSNQSKWVRNFYMRDFNDRSIDAALGGQVLTRTGSTYAPIFQKHRSHQGVRM